MKIQNRLCSSHLLCSAESSSHERENIVAGPVDELGHQGQKVVPFSDMSCVRGSQIS